jgi:hypothetical protein
MKETSYDTCRFGDSDFGTFEVKITSDRNLPVVICSRNLHWLFLVCLCKT